MHQVLIIPEGVESSNDRSFPVGKLTWRESVPMMFIDQTTERHQMAVHVGNITNIRRQTIEGETWIVGDLAWDTDNEAMEARRLADEEKIPGVSADIAVRVTAEDEWGEILDFEAEIVGVTQVPMPQFSGARIVRGDLMPITASAQPKDAFFMPEPPDDDPRYVLQPHGELAIPLTFEGRRFYGHAGVSGQCHTGFLKQCITPPESQTDYALFHTGETLTETGAIPTGTVVWRGDHAPITVAADGAQDHYAHNAYAWGDARAYNGRHGVWVCGIVRDSVTDDELETLRKGTWSGDWRRGELVGLLAVNQSAFPVARLAASAGVPEALIASGAIGEPEPEEIPAWAQELNAKVDSLIERLDVPAVDLEVTEEPEPENVIDLNAGHIARILGQ